MVEPPVPARRKGHRGGFLMGTLKSLPKKRFQPFWTILQSECKFVHKTFKALFKEGLDLPHYNGCVEHAVGKAPFVVIPGNNTAEGPLDHGCLRQISDAAVGIVVEVG